MTRKQMTRQQQRITRSPVQEFIRLTPLANIHTHNPHKPFLYTWTCLRVSCTPHWSMTPPMHSIYASMSVTPRIQLSIFVLQLLPFPEMCCEFSFRGWVFVFVLHFVHVMHFISCHHVHRICIRVRLMHQSIFLVVRFAIRHSYVLQHPLLSLFVCGC